MIRLGIIEDTIDIREVLVAYFSRQEKFEVLHHANNAEDFLINAKLSELDVIICDIGLPRMSGVEACWIFKQQQPNVQVLMYTVFESDNYLFEALKAGASGYMLKQDNLEELCEAVIEVSKGGGVMGSQIAKKVMDFFSKGPASLNKNEFSLTDREREVAEYLVKGVTVKEIADALSLSSDTIKFHIKNIYNKLQVHNRDTFMKKYKSD